jgi:tryptophan-rich sensory protein
MTDSTKKLKIAAIVTGIAAAGVFNGISGGMSQSCPVNSEDADYIAAGFQPPNEVFAVVWPILYTVLGAAAGAYVWGLRKDKRAAIAALVLLGLQMAFNFSWIDAFSCKKDTKAAMYIALAMIALTIATIVVGLRASKVGSALLTPYLTWLIFALMLNANVVDKGNDAAAEASI